MKPWWMYVVLTATGRQLYCGISTDVKNRVRVHNRGQGAKFLQGSRLPCKLLVSWCFEGADAHSNALKAEAWFKKQCKADKVKLVQTNTPLPARFGASFACQEAFSPETRSAIGAQS